MQLKDQAIVMARSGRSPSDIAKMLAVPDSLIKCWTSAVAANKQHEAEDYRPKRASVPSGAPRGSLERIEAMAKRFELGEDLYHQWDDQSTEPPEVERRRKSRRDDKARSEARK